MAHRRNTNARSSAEWPGLVARKIEAQGRTGSFEPDVIMPRSDRLVSMIGSENLPGGTDRFSPPTTQPPDDKDNGVKGNESLEESSIVKRKCGEDSTDNEEGSMMEAGMDADVPESNETSQLFPPDNSELSMGKEK
eukprot:6844686-Ditylum_brightwellii.AAC.1